MTLLEKQCTVICVERVQTFIRQLEDDREPQLNYFGDDYAEGKDSGYHEALDDISELLYEYCQDSAKGLEDMKKMLEERLK